MGSSGPASATAPSEKPEKPNDRGGNWLTELASFEYFSTLPLELRLDIWRLCLPRCVRGINDKLLRSQKLNHLGLPGKGNNKSFGIFSPPLVAQVCREARRVAFEYGRLYDNSTPWNVSKIWIDPSRDIVYLNDSFELNSRGSWSFPSSGHVMNVAMNARVLSLHLPWLRGRPGHILNEKLIKSGQTSQIIVCEDQFTIKIPHEQAVGCGLFGLWAEERLVLIDTSDQILLQRFNRLPHKYAQRPAGTFNAWNGGLPERPDAAFALTDCSSISRVNAIRESVEDCWLECLWFLNQDDQDDQDDSALIISDGTLLGFKRHHPWTAKALKSLPKVQVALAFQLFTLKASSKVTIHHTEEDAPRAIEMARD